MDKELLKEIITRYESTIFLVQRKLNALIREQSPDGVTLDQYSTLRYIRGRGQSTSSELADSLCVGRSSITAIINRLVDKELIRRLPDEKDRRVTYLELTEEGLRQCGEMEESIRDLMGTYIEDFEEIEARRFIETFEKLARIMMET